MELFEIASKTTTICKDPNLKGNLMRGHIITENATGTAWLYAPEANLYFRPYEDNIYGLLILSWSTDGYHRIAGGYVPTKEWFAAHFAIGEPCEIPDDIVRFIVQRDEALEDFAGQLGEDLRAPALTLQKALQAVRDHLANLDTPAVTSMEILERHYTSELMQLFRELQIPM